MVTLFECWNGGTVQWDQINPPQFVFAFPPESFEVVTFFQLSGRICEVLTQCEWHLNFGGQLFDIPNLPPHEINNFVLNVRNSMGYVSIPVPYSLGNPFSGYTNISLALWVNVCTGRADMHNPFTGLVYGQQLLRPQSQFNIPMPTANFQMNITPQGTVQSGGAQNTLQSIAKIVGGVGKIAEFLTQAGIFGDSSQGGCY